jgi:integrase
MAKKTRDGLYKRGRFWWIRTDPITGLPESTKCTDLEAAKRVRSSRERIASDPHHAAAQTARLVDWIGEFLKMKRRQVKNGKRSEKTVTYYEKKLGHFPRVLGMDLVMSDLIPREADVYIAQRRDEEVKETTISKEIAALQMVASMAKRGGCYALDPDDLRPQDLTSEYVPVERALPPDEVAALCSELEPERSALVLVAVGLGVRLSEAQRMLPEDIDLEGGFVAIRGTKTKASKRTVPVLSVFRPLVENAIPYLPLKPWPNMYRGLDAAARRAGIAGCTPNDFRRSHATILQEAGVDKNVVAKLLGHTSPAMVDRVYGKPRAAALGELAERSIERNVFVTPATPREHCTPSATVAKCSESQKTADSDDHRTGFLIHWSPVRIGAGVPENATFEKRASRKRSVRSVARLALGYAALRLGLLGEVAA